MSYLLKFQTSTGVMVEYILKNSKHGRATCYSCRHCIHCCSHSRRSARQFSTYITELKLLSVKKKVAKVKESNSLDTTAIDAQKLIQLNSKRPYLKKKESNFNVKNKTFELKNNFNINNPKSNSPNLIFNSVKVEKYFDKLKDDRKIQNSLEAKEMQTTQSQENLNQNKHNVNGFVFSKIKGQLAKPSKKDVNIMQNNFKVNKENLFRLLNVNKTNQNQSLKTSVQMSALNIKEEEEEEEGEKEALENNLQILPKAGEGKIFQTYESLQKKKKTDDFQRISKHCNNYDSFIQYVMSSVDVCITNDNLLEGFDLFQTARKKHLWKFFVKQKNKKLINVYNTLLDSLASKGHWYLTTKVIEWMKYDHVSLNSESFASILYCLGKNRKYGNERFIEEEIPKVIKQLFASNISLDDIFAKVILTKEKAEKILSVIRVVVPSFNIKPASVNLNSDCPLIKNLYTAHCNLESPVKGLGIDCLENLVEEQLLLEKKFFIKIKPVSRGHSDNFFSQYQQKLENLKENWRNSLNEAIFKLKHKMKQQSHRANFFDLNVYLNSVPTEQLVDILMDFTEMLFTYSGGFSPSTVQIRLMIGTRIAECYQMRKKEITGIVDATENLSKKYANWYIDPRGPAQNSRQVWQMLIQDSDNASHIDLPIIKWPREILNSLGEFLLGIIVKEVKFTTKNSSTAKSYPVFYTILRYHGENWREEIKSHPYLASLLEKIGFNILSFRADEMPMVCPPKPWKNADHGGYLLLSTDFVRKPMNIAGKNIKFNEVPVQKLYPSFDSLNALQAIPWRVNEEVLDVVLDIFKNGGSEELSVPHLPQINRNEFKITPEMSHEERMEVLRNKKEIIKKKMDDYGLWCEALYRLSLANHFRKRIFWFPQNCDFRGRVYPVPPLLNHLGSDLFRSLLVFAKSKPLGPKGLDWIKIHLINLAGTHKKKPIEERLAYANEILPVILDSAEKPLTGFKWWTKADEPWQALAACMEIRKILSSPNPEQYSCRFPIHQDGSCNGLQHYAALGKDLMGARSVNLTPLEQPQDVYSVVAQLVEEERKKDAKAGEEIAIMLENYVERKVVKQTVMTTVYGVTRYGARLQIAKKLKEIPSFPEEYVNVASIYLAEKVFFCLKKMFTSTRKIQDWFINCANTICSMNEYVEYTSPLGLPVLQSYGKYKKSNTRNRVIVPNKMKQRNAFPPNFIHSLDSCHMMLTALYCEQAGITFAAVHDCFWTHPNTVEIMNEICREQFISLHSQPILEDLSQFFKKHYLQNQPARNKTASDIFEAVPEKGEFDLKNIRNSVYFFS